MPQPRPRIDLDEFARLLGEHHLETSLAGDDSRHWALFDALARHSDEFWRNVGRRLRDGDMELSEIVGDHRTWEGLRQAALLDPEETDHILRSLMAHVSARPTVLSVYREAEEFPGVDSAPVLAPTPSPKAEGPSKDDVTADPSAAPEGPMGFDDLATRIADHHARSAPAGDDSRHWALFEALASQSDPLWREIGTRLSAGDLELDEVFADHRWRRRIERSLVLMPESTADVLAYIAAHLGHSPGPLRLIETWMEVAACATDDEHRAPEEDQARSGSSPGPEQRDPLDDENPWSPPATDLYD